MGLLSTAKKLLGKIAIPERNDDKQIASKTISINIGIDFGTSYSKVCFAERKEFHFVHFDKSEYKPSVVYFDYKNNVLYYEKPNNTGFFEEIKYFKYSMIDDTLPKSENLANLCLNTKPEILCCLFFLTCLIKESKEYAYNYFLNILGDIKIDWSITMGVPIDNYENKNRQLYDRLLNIAYKLSDQLTNFTISVNILQNYYLENENIQIPKFQDSPINTLPELYAESLAFLQNRNVMNGVYVLVDIGGGTVDLAIMYKESSNRYSMVSKSIKPLGIEIIANNIVLNKKFIDHVITYLQTHRSLFNLAYVSGEKEDEYKKMFKMAYAELIADDLKKNGAWKEGIEKALHERNRVLEIFLCGGGANSRWYRDGIEQKNWDLRCLLVNDLNLKILPVEKLLPDDDKNHYLNHRLLIAYILSKPIETIPPLSGFPWDFQRINHVHTNEDSHDRYYSQQEKLKDKYGEYL